MTNVTILGAGVVGLTTALVLQEHGCDVRVVASATGRAITSAVAGAIWFPFRAEPREHVVRWAIRTRQWLTDLARTTPEAGVDVLRLFQMEANDSPPWWGVGIEDLAILRSGFPGPAPYAWTCTAPRVDPLPHLAWLESRLARPIEVRRVGSIGELLDERADAIVNCTGLASRELASDPRMRPLFGQTVVASLEGLDPTVSIGDDRNPAGVFYAIPRRSEIVIGGCTMAWERAVAEGIGPEPDPEIREGILARAAQYGIVPRRILRDVAGLRPFRDAVRVERDPAEPRVIHNYGHGGSGYTIARACAEDVAAIIGV